MATSINKTTFHSNNGTTVTIDELVELKTRIILLEEIIIDLLKTNNNPEITLKYIDLITKDK